MLKNKQDPDAIASGAMALASAQERDAYIAQACGNDADLRQQVEERVAAHFPTDSHAEPGHPANPEGRDVPLTRLGPYKVVKQIGEGAAGIVFQGEQQEPVRLLVALKVIKEGRDWRQIVSRFEAERQALSLVDHPNIAKLLGAGTRPSGQPYFVMEWIEGAPLTKYCDDQKLSLRQRLELFVPVCQAVQYAHQKGFIHGDLKPSNVLAASPKDKAAPKILDLGVARAVRGKPGESCPSADPDGPGGKTEYLSPEQADANIHDVDTRSDVYSLGVLLYELLTGTTPLRRERLKDVSATEAMRLIREEEVPPPSQRLNESKDNLASISAQRQMKPAALVKEVSGELDCLVMKALEKDRARRYQTAHDLARDIQHYLAREPMEACPPSDKQRLWQTARHHPGALTATVGILLLLLAAAVAGAALGVWALRKEEQAQKSEQDAVKKQDQAQKAEKETKDKLHQTEAARKAALKERDQAQEAEQAARRSEEDMKAVLAFFKDKLLSAGRPADVSLSDAFWAGGQNKDVTLRKAVDTAEPRVAEAFADRPLGEAAIREILGMTYLNLGEPARAVQEYQRALALREAMLGANHADTAECRNKLAVAYRLAGNAAEAGRLFDQNLHSSTHASALAVRGGMLLSQKKPAEAELKLRECLTIRQKIQPDDWTTFDVKSMLGEALVEQKKYLDAEPLLLSGYEGMKQREANIPSQDKSRLTKALERLVQLYEAWSKPDKAAQWQKELEAIKSAKKT